MEFVMTRHKTLNKIKNQYENFINDFVYKNYNQSLLTLEENKANWKKLYGYTPHMESELMHQTKVFLRLIKNYNNEFTTRLVDFIANFLSPYIEKSDTFKYDTDAAHKHIINELNKHLDERNMTREINNAANAINGNSLKNALTLNYPLFTNNVRITIGGIKQEIYIDKKRIVLEYTDWEDFNTNQQSRILNALQTLRLKKKEKAKQDAIKKQKNKKQKLSPLAKTMRAINRKKRELSAPVDNKGSK